MKRDVAGIAGASGRLNVVRTTYDALGRAVRTQVDTAEVDASISIEGTRLVERGYDGLGRAVRASNEVCVVTATYDSLGRTLAEATTLAATGQLFNGRRFIAKLPLRILQPRRGGQPQRVGTSQLMQAIADLL